MQGKWIIPVLGSTVVWLSSVGLQAQSPWRSLSEHLFVPRLTSAAYTELGLTEQQTESIRKEVEGARKEFVRLQAELETEVAALAELLAADEPDEQTALEQLDKVLAVEHQIKRR